MNKLGKKIRSERKKNNLTLKQLAERVGVSHITLQRIETGKSSPSVFLLSEIAYNLQKPVYSFLSDMDNSITLLKAENQRVVSNDSFEVSIIAPRKMIADDITVTYGELKEGRSIGPHANQGIEWAYNIEGRCMLEVSGQSVILEAKDSVYYNARMEHTVTALENVKFISIYLEDKRLPERS